MFDLLCCQTERSHNGPRHMTLKTYWEFSRRLVDKSYSSWQLLIATIFSFQEFWNILVISQWNYCLIRLLIASWQLISSAISIIFRVKAASTCLNLSVLVEGRWGGEVLSQETVVCYLCWFNTQTKYPLWPNRTWVYLGACAYLTFKQVLCITSLPLCLSLPTVQTAAYFQKYLASLGSLTEGDSR